MRHAGLLRGLANATRDFIDDNVEMRRVSAQQAANTDDRIVFAAGCQATRCRRNFKGPRHANHVDVFLPRPGSQQAVARAQQQALSDEGIESCYYNREALSRSLELPL